METQEIVKVTPNELQSELIPKTKTKQRKIIKESPNLRPLLKLSRVNLKSINKSKYGIQREKNKDSMEHSEVGIVHNMLNEDSYSNILEKRKVSNISFGLVKDESAEKVKAQLKLENISQLKKRRMETKSYLKNNKPNSSVDYGVPSKLQSESKVLPCINEVQRSLPNVKRKVSKNMHSAGKTTLNTKGTSLFVRFMEDTLLPKLKQEDNKVPKQNRNNSFINPLIDLNHSKSSLERVNPFVKSIHKGTVINKLIIDFICSNSW